MFSQARVNIDPTSKSSNNTTTNNNSNNNSSNNSNNTTKMESWNSCSKLLPTPLQNHAELDDLCVINEATIQQEIPNGDPITIDNDLMIGTMLPMFRTTDADDIPGSVKGSAANDRVSDYFRPKKRRFEIQLQIKLKHVPDGQLFFGCEMDKTLELGIVQRTFLTAIMSFIQKKNNNGLLFNLTGEEEAADGDYEKPHLALNFDTSADRFIVSKPGDEPPRLGAELYEDPEALKRRKKGGVPFPYSTEDTYTVAVWSAYIDFAQWKCINIPAISSFNLSSVIGDQIFRIHWYLADGALNTHKQKDIKRILSYEFGHKVESKTGPSARIYLEKLRLNNAEALGQCASLEEVQSLEEVEESYIGGLFSYLSLYK